jgi:hypothetical protein
VGLTFPEGRRFAFTIMDDTDVATVENVKPIYRLLERLGFRTTKTVWPMACPEGSPAFSSSETLEDPEYLEFVLDLQRRGFEIAYHGATMESSTRDRTQHALERVRQHFGETPRVYANHAYNRENLYWGEHRVDDPLIRFFYARTNGMPRGYYQGILEGSPWWWGDLAGSIPYVRNLTFASLNTLAVNPSMPYHDPNRPLVSWWFSASDAEDVHAFNHLLRPEEQDRLEREGGLAIVATHLGKGFVLDGRVHPETERALTRLAGKPGWLVPVGDLLEWLRRARNGGSALPASEWRRMQRRWAVDLILRRLKRRREP